MALLDLPFSADYFQSFFVKAGVKPQIKERTRDMAVLRSLVANGYGYSIANVRPLNARSPDGKPLHFVPIIGDVRPMKMGILTTRRQKMSTSSVPSFNIAKSNVLAMR